MKAATFLVALLLTAPGTWARDFRCRTTNCTPAARCLNEANSLLEEGEFVEAGCRYKRARAADPASDEAAIGHAISLTLVGWAETAKPIFRRLATSGDTPQIRDAANQWIGAIDDPIVVTLTFDKAVDCRERNPEWSRVEPGQMVTKWLAGRLRNLAIVTVEEEGKVTCEGCSPPDFRLHVRCTCPKSDRHPARASISVFDHRGKVVHSLSAESTPSLLQHASTPAMKASLKIDNAVRKLMFDLILYLAFENSPQP